LPVRDIARRSRRGPAEQPTKQPSRRTSADIDGRQGQVDEDQDHDHDHDDQQAATNS
jgi:hypothetical protein